MRSLRIFSRHVQSSSIEEVFNLDLVNRDITTLIDNERGNQLTSKFPEYELESMEIEDNFGKRTKIKFEAISNLLKGISKL